MQLPIKRILALALASTPAFAQTKPARGGLAGILADDDRVILELVARDMQTLQQYMFKKDRIAPERQAAFKAVVAVRQLDDPNIKLTRRQRIELVMNVARGIDLVLPTIGSAEELMKLNRTLVLVGVGGPLNMIEYWGEDPKTQAELHPVAEAVDKVYEKAFALAEADKKRIEGMMTGVTQAQLAGQWEKADNLATLARYSAACNKYALAVSLDRIDPVRAEVCKKGIESLKEFEDPAFDASARITATLNVGKLLVAQGTPQSCEEAKARFQRILKDEQAQWGQKFEAIYFTAVADVVRKDVDSARGDAVAVSQWLRANKPQGDAETVKKVLEGTDAALDMLTFRVLSTAAQVGDPAAKKEADQAAMDVLQRLLAKRPDLAWAIHQQMLLRLPENPDMRQLSPLLLTAMLRRGGDEIRRPAGEAVNKTAIMQGIAAAREIIRCVEEKDPRARDLAAKDAEEASLYLGFFFDRIGSSLEAATAFVDFVEKYKASDSLQLAFENADYEVSKLRRQPNPPASFPDLQIRFLQIATAPPFSRRQYSYDYANLLVRRNDALIKSGNYDDARKARMIADATKAAELFRESPPEQRVNARYMEMVAYDQLIDLADPQKVAPYVAKVNELADEVNRLIDEELPRTTDKDKQILLRSNKARTAQLLAEMAEHASPSDKPAAMEKALKLLDNIKDIVAGLPDADDMLSGALTARINLKMRLGRASEAMGDLDEFLKGVSPAAGLSITARMMQSLNHEFDAAEQRNDTARMRELAEAIAKVSDYVVQQASQSTDPERRKLVPELVQYRANANLKAARLTGDPVRRREYNAAALNVFRQSLTQADAAVKAAQAELDKDPSNEAKQKALKDETGRQKKLQLDIARVQWEMGDKDAIAAARATFAEMLSKKELGGPMNGSEYNDPYWEVTYKLLDCNARLLSGADLDSTKGKLKELYILWEDQPGGPKWTKEFDKLRKSLLGDWAPPKPAAATRQ